MIPFRLILVLIVLTAPVLFAANGERPAPLQPYVPLIEKCRQYDSGVLFPGQTFVEEFKKGGRVTWKTVKTNGQQSTLELSNQDGRDVLVITPIYQNALVALGPQVAGDFSVEMVACSDSHRPCDLSLMTSAAGSVTVTAPGAGPAFQFGGHYNTRNLLWTDTGASNTWQTVELPATSLIQPRRWHTIRMEISGRELIGSVDGKELGRTKLSDHYDPTSTWQPLIYCYESRIVVSRLTVSRPGDLVRARAKAWQQAFGELTTAQVDKKIEQLIAFLDHDDSRLRDGAQRLLTEAGPFVFPALSQILQNGSFEQRLRAREILDHE